MYDRRKRTVIESSDPQKRSFSPRPPPPPPPLPSSLSSSGFSSSFSSLSSSSSSSSSFSSSSSSSSSSFSASFFFSPSPGSDVGKNKGENGQGGVEGGRPVHRRYPLSSSSFSFSPFSSFSPSPSSSSSHSSPPIPSASPSSAFFLSFPPSSTGVRVSAYDKAGREGWITPVTRQPRPSPHPIRFDSFSGPCRCCAGGEGGLRLSLNVGRPRSSPHVRSLCSLLHHHPHALLLLSPPHAFTTALPRLGKRGLEGLSVFLRPPPETFLRNAGEMLTRRLPENSEREKDYEEGFGGEEKKTAPHMEAP
uniref:Uncharacterized protein n=1 Tax=Chromera velia CCMP2878 TaxID=1169474 RepID=A0A0G4I8G9_9ALVE|eukprot:Cvel_11928.t1-p1 / transcript=Cvel_11928.t1 / gene=Cvel_11928 / organism=Chromera_velia_CCMP2878 / gene_product=hypothetical protein / transcript_product=hypothetical protein / location=Cvel_scaffold764:31715-33015(+) / protein_length=305 / sequence_SO=supercontig / SO=protein_coding / is_pseudo=false